MIVTREQQQAILQKYVLEDHNASECIGFVDGINATLELVNEILIKEKENKINTLIQCQKILERLNTINANDANEKLKQIIKEF